MIRLKRVWKIEANLPDRKVFRKKRNVCTGFLSNQRDLFCESCAIGMKQAKLNLDLILISKRPSIIYPDFEVAILWFSEITHRTINNDNYPQ